MLKQFFLVAAALVTLSACGSAHNPPVGTGIQCDMNTESFAVYPNWGATVPDGNFAIVAGRIPPNTRVILNPDGHNTPEDRFYGTVFGPVTVDTSSFTLPAGVSVTDLRQAFVPPLKPKTTYDWTISPSQGGCQALGWFTTQ